MSQKIKKLISFLICICFLFEQTGFAQLVSAPALPSWSTLPTLRYLSVNSANPFNYFNFLLERGDKPFTKDKLDTESRKLINYFFLGLTLPAESLWVNLKPDEPGRITSDTLAETDLGRILLEQDLQLKKDVARYTHPAHPIGKEFWEKLYAQIGKDKVKKTKITTSNRVWIVPDEAIVVETEDGAFIASAKLKVLLENDYLKLNTKDENQTLSEKLMKEIILPSLSEEINKGATYAPLRQIYNSLILAEWYKRKFKQGLSPSEASGTVPETAKGNVPNPYIEVINKGYTKGLESEFPWSKQKIWQDYVESYSKGEYKQQAEIFGLRRMYFSGGIFFGELSDSSPNSVNSPASAGSGILKIVSLSAPNVVSQSDKPTEIAKSPTINEMPEVATILDSAKRSLIPVLGISDGIILNKTGFPVFKRTEVIDLKEAPSSLAVYQPLKGQPIPGASLPKIAGSPAVPTASSGIEGEKGVDIKDFLSKGDFLLFHLFGKNKKQLQELEYLLNSTFKSLGTKRVFAGLIINDWKRRWKSKIEDGIEVLKLIKNIRELLGEYFGDERYFANLVFLRSSEYPVAEIKNIFNDLLGDLKTAQASNIKIEDIIKKWEGDKRCLDEGMKAMVSFILEANIKDEKLRIKRLLEKMFPSDEIPSQIGIKGERFLNQPAGPSTERPVYNLAEYKNKEYISWKEANIGIQQDRDELNKIAEYLSHQEQRKVTSEEVLNHIIARMKELLVLSNLARQTRPEERNPEFVSNGRKYTVYVMRDGGIDVTLIFNDPFDTKIDRVLRLNKYSIWLNQMGVFYKGEPTNDIYRSGDTSYGPWGGSKNWDQVYPISPIRFYDDHIGTLDFARLAIVHEVKKDLSTGSPLKLNKEEIDLILNQPVESLDKQLNPSIIHRKTDKEPVILMSFGAEERLVSELKRDDGKLKALIKGKDVVAIPGYGTNGFIMALEGEVRSVTVIDLDPVTIAWLKAIKKYFKYKGENPSSIGEVFLTNSLEDEKWRSNFELMVRLIKEAVAKGIDGFELDNDITFQVGNIKDIRLENEKKFDFALIPYLFDQKNGILKPEEVSEAIENVGNLMKRDGHIMIVPEMSFNDRLKSLGYHIETDKYPDEGRGPLSYSIIDLSRSSLTGIESTSGSPAGKNWNLVEEMLQKGTRHKINEFREKYSHLDWEMEKLDINTLFTDNPILQLVNMQYQKFHKYANLPTSVPPIMVVFESGKYIIKDGFHRVVAARIKGSHMIDAFVASITSAASPTALQPEEIERVIDEVTLSERGFSDFANRNILRGYLYGDFYTLVVSAVFIAKDNYDYTTGDLRVYQAIAILINARIAAQFKKPYIRIKSLFAPYFSGEKDIDEIMPSALKELKINEDEASNICVTLDDLAKSVGSPVPSEVEGPADQAVTASSGVEKSKIFTPQNELRLLLQNAAAREEKYVHPDAGAVLDAKGILETVKARPDLEYELAKQIVMISPPTKQDKIEDSISLLIAKVFRSPSFQKGERRLWIYVDKQGQPIGRMYVAIRHLSRDNPLSKKYDTNYIGRLERIDISPEYRLGGRGTFLLDAFFNDLKKQRVGMAEITSAKGAVGFYLQYLEDKGIPEKEFQKYGIMKQESRNTNETIFRIPVRVIMSAGSPAQPASSGVEQLDYKPIEQALNQMKGYVQDWLNKDPAKPVLILLDGEYENIGGRTGKTTLARAIDPDEIPESIYGNSFKNLGLNIKQKISVVYGHSLVNLFETIQRINPDTRHLDLSRLKKNHRPLARMEHFIKENTFFADIFPLYIQLLFSDMEVKNVRRSRAQTENRIVLYEGVGSYNYLRETDKPLLYRRALEPTLVIKAYIKADVKGRSMSVEPYKWDTNGKFQRTFTESQPDIADSPLTEAESVSSAMEDRKEGEVDWRKRKALKLLGLGGLATIIDPLWPFKVLADLTPESIKDYSFDSLLEKTKNLRRGRTGGFYDDLKLIHSFGLFTNLVDENNIDILLKDYKNKISRNEKLLQTIGNVIKDKSCFLAFQSFLREGGKIEATLSGGHYNPKPLTISVSLVDSTTINGKDIKENKSDLEIQLNFYHELLHYVLDKTDNILAEIIDDVGGLDHVLIERLETRFIVIQLIREGRLPLLSEDKKRSLEEKLREQDVISLAIEQKIRGLYRPLSHGNLGDELWRNINKLEELEQLLNSDEKFYETYVHNTQPSSREKQLLTERQCQGLDYLAAYEANIVRQALLLAIKISRESNEPLELVFVRNDFKKIFGEFMKRFSEEVEKSPFRSLKSIAEESMNSALKKEVMNFSDTITTSGSPAEAKTASSAVENDFALVSAKQRSSVNEEGIKEFKEFLKKLENKDITISLKVSPAAVTKLLKYGKDFEVLYTIWHTVLNNAYKTYGIIEDALVIVAKRIIAELEGSPISGIEEFRIYRDLLKEGGIRIYQNEGNITRIVFGFSNEFAPFYDLFLKKWREAVEKAQACTRDDFVKVADSILKENGVEIKEPAAVLSEETNPLSPDQLQKGLGEFEKFYLLLQAKKISVDLGVNPDDAARQLGFGEGFIRLYRQWWTEVRSAYRRSGITHKGSLKIAEQMMAEKGLKKYHSQNNCFDEFTEFFTGWGLRGSGEVLDINASGDEMRKTWGYGEGFGVLYDILLERLYNLYVNPNRGFSKEDVKRIGSGILSELGRSNVQIGQNGREDLRQMVDWVEKRELNPNILGFLSGKQIQKIYRFNKDFIPLYDLWSMKVRQSAEQIKRMSIDDSISFIVQLGREIIGVAGGNNLLENNPTSEENPSTAVASPITAKMFRLLDRLAGKIGQNHRFDSLTGFLEANISDPFGTDWHQLISILRDTKLIDDSTSQWLKNISGLKQRKVNLYLALRYLDLLENGMMFHGTSSNSLLSIQKNGINSKYAIPTQEEIDAVFEISRDLKQMDFKPSLGISFSYNPSAALGYGMQGSEALIFTLKIAKDLLGRDINIQQKKTLTDFVNKYELYYKNHQPMLLAVLFKKMPEYSKGLFREPAEEFAERILNNMVFSEEIPEESLLEKIDGKVYILMSKSFRGKIMNPDTLYSPEDVFIFIRDDAKWRMVNIREARPKDIDGSGQYLRGRHEIIKGDYGKNDTNYLFSAEEVSFDLELQKVSMGFESTWFGKGKSNKTTTDSPSTGDKGSIDGSTSSPSIADKKEGGIDLSRIELTLKDERYISTLNPAEVKVLRAAKALKDNWDSLSLLYVHEVILLLKDNLVKELENKELLENVLEQLKIKTFLDPQALQFFNLIQSQKPLAEINLAQLD